MLLNGTNSDTHNNNYDYIDDYGFYTIINLWNKLSNFCQRYTGILNCQNKLINGYIN